jgi:hypothetical protein
MTQNTQTNVIYFEQATNAQFICSNSNAMSICTLQCLFMPSSSALIPMYMCVHRNLYLYPVHLLLIPMTICASQSLFCHSYVVNE